MNAQSGPVTQDKPAEAAKFAAEIQAAVRYEKGLVVKALVALVLVAAVVLARLLYLA